MAQPQEEVPWWDKFSTLGSRDAPLYSKETLLRQFNILGDILNAGTLLIDVRRTDHEGGTIRGSLNMPAQSFPYHMATLYRLCHGDGVNVISRVMFYCGTLSFLELLQLLRALIFSPSSCRAVHFTFHRTNNC